MVERSKDWMAQAERDLEHARWCGRRGYHEWTCFSAQQAAIKAVKSLYQALHAFAWGHFVSALLRGLPDGYGPDCHTLEAGMRLDGLYDQERIAQDQLSLMHARSIQPRYPHGFAYGNHRDYFSKYEALEDAARVLAYCKGKLP